MRDGMRKYVAEFVGTLLLVFLAVGSAVFGINQLGAVGVAFAFGLVLLALCYAIGPVSGSHVNPAVTLGMLLARRISVRDAVGYVIAQLIGGVAGAALIKLVLSAGGVQDQTGNVGADAFGAGHGINAGGSFILEVILTFVLVSVVLLMTGRAAAPGFAGIAIGFTLALVHLVGVPLHGTSVNPARALGPAIFAGGTSLSQVWLFLIAPMVGGALAAAVWPALRATEDAPRYGLAAELSDTSVERAASAAVHDVQAERREAADVADAASDHRPPDR